MNVRLRWRVQRAVLEAAAALQVLPKNTRADPLNLGGRPAERVTVGSVESRCAVLYLHGGGYTVCSPATHRSLAAHLAEALGSVVYVPDYRLAPEHLYPAALDDAEAAFQELMSTGLAPEAVAVAGDSAGAGLALALAQRLRDRHGIRPAALGLIAPWSDPNETAARKRDLVIDRRWSRASAQAYLGDGDPLDPGYAPLFGDMIRLPPTYVQADDGELLRAQCGRLVAALREAGVPTQFSVTRGLWHVAQLQAALVAPAAAVLREEAAFLGESMRAAQTGSIG